MDTPEALYSCWGAFTKIDEKFYQILTVEGEVCASGVKFSQYFQKQLKLYCHPFSPEVHFLLEVVVEFSLQTETDGSFSVFVNKVVCDNRTKEWNRWIAFLQKLGPCYQGEKVTSILLTQNGTSLIKHFEYDTAVSWQDAMVDCAKFVAAAKYCLVLFKNGTYAVGAQEQRALWRPALECSDGS